MISTVTQHICNDCLLPCVNSGDFVSAAEPIGTLDNKGCITPYCVTKYGIVQKCICIVHGHMHHCMTNHCVCNNNCKRKQQQLQKKAATIAQALQNNAKHWELNRAGTTPMLELYTTLARCEYEQDELIVEENIDGMDMVLGVMFADSETGSGTNVTLRLGYYLPGNQILGLHMHRVAHAHA